MLQIDHRVSHDIDIFLPDPQLLAYLDPQKRDFDLEVGPTEYDGDGTRFLKLAFEGIGQIDFIVGSSITASPTTRRMIKNEIVELENVPEIITKKVYYRGPNIRPRDIFELQRRRTRMQMRPLKHCVSFEARSPGRSLPSID